MTELSQETIEARTRYEAQQRAIQENLSRIAALEVGDRVRVISLTIGDRWEKETVIAHKTPGGSFRVELNPDWLFKLPKYQDDYRCREKGGRRYGDRVYILEPIE